MRVTRRLELIVLSGLFVDVDVSEPKLMRLQNGVVGGMLMSSAAS